MFLIHQEFSWQPDKPVARRNKVRQSTAGNPVDSRLPPAAQGHRKRGRRLNDSLSLFFVLFFFRLDDFLAIIVAAFRAYMMRTHQLVALRTFNQARSSQFPISATGIAASFRHLSLWYCHYQTPPKLNLFL
jgi:hypothetical protein